MKYLITGGAGFIGSNYANRLIERGEDVVVFDNLSRQGAKRNIEWLQEKFGKNSFELNVNDVRNIQEIQTAINDVEAIIHLAAQVAVTTSVINPRSDFEINALGTFNVLEAARISGNKPIIIYASTNKVYGEMEDIPVVEQEEQYQYSNLPWGIPEERSLDFHSPYGCSKGSGDQYAHDYFKIFGLPTIVFRQSCIYGTRQFGVEDQGWIAWFIIALLTGKPITIYGDGKQVRDVLFIDDLLDAYDNAISRKSTSRGKIYNVGGGPKNTLSVWRQFGSILERLNNNKVRVKFGEWRPGDQKIYISDIRKVSNELNWTPRIGVETGIENVFYWAQKNKSLFL